MYFIDCHVLLLQGGCFDRTGVTEKAISLFDPHLDVHWPVPDGVQPIISQKDHIAPNLPLPPLEVLRKRILVIGASGQGSYFLSLFITGYRLLGPGLFVFIAKQPALLVYK